MHKRGEGGDTLLDLQGPDVGHYAVACHFGVNLKLSSQKVITYSKRLDADPTSEGNISYDRQKGSQKEGGQEISSSRCLLVVFVLPIFGLHHHGVNELSVLHDCLLVHVETGHSCEILSTLYVD
jgi:hypothetical protein